MSLSAAPPDSCSDWRSTARCSTAEAAGHTGGQRGKGGDILWRWGNPAAYQAGPDGAQQLFGQHDPRFIPPGTPGAGHVTLFNNKYLAGQSAVFELELPLDVSGNIVLASTGVYGPVSPFWSFTEPGFYSRFVSSAERLANGNTLICSGAQKLLLEVDVLGNTVWSHTHQSYQALFQGHGVERSLWADRAESSVAGGDVRFNHVTGSEHADSTCCSDR